jgi:protein-tyrosine phosphatase
MPGFIDLHCHYLPSIDDGVTSMDMGLELLESLASVGFAHVVATPHMRPSMFDNEAPALRALYADVAARVAAERAGGRALPETSLASEHYFDDVVFARVMKGEGLPLGVGRALLVEFNTERWPVSFEARLYDLRRKRLRPIIAHPERYAMLWTDTRASAERVQRAGGALLLDVCALTGKYGSRAQRAAEELVDEGAYYAACSDAHRPADADDTGRAIDRLRALVGQDEVTRLMATGPQEILQGRIVDTYD